MEIECVASKCKPNGCILFGEVTEAFIKSEVKQGRDESEIGHTGKDGKKYKCGTYAQHGVKVDHIKEEDRLKKEIARLNALLLDKQIAEGKANPDTVSVEPSKTPVKTKTLKDARKDSW